MVVGWKGGLVVWAYRPRGEHVVGGGDEKRKGRAGPPGGS